MLPTFEIYIKFHSSSPEGLGVLKQNQTMLSATLE